MASESKLRWGIMGCARISRRGLIPGIQGSQTGELAAIASRDRAAARAWAHEFQIPRSYGSYEELLADPAIDAVYIPLPNELHEPWTIAAAHAGKHVLCEKPLARTVAEAERMTAACRARGVLLMEAFMWRFQPRVEAIRKLIDSGAIGDIRLIRTSFSFPIDPGDWRLDPARGGGALFDVGCYGVSAARLFADAEPTHVKAFARRGETGVDLTLVAQFAFPSGIIGVLDCGFEEPFRCSIEIVGTDGVVEIPRAFLPPELPTAIVRDRGVDVESLVREAGASNEKNAEKPAVESERTLTFDGYNQYAAMVDAFARSVRSRKLEPPAEDGLEQMKTIETLLKTAYYL